MIHDNINETIENLIAFSLHHRLDVILSFQFILKICFQCLMISYFFHFFSQTLLFLSEIMIKSNFCVFVKFHRMQLNQALFSLVNA